MTVATEQRSAIGLRGQTTADGVQARPWPWPRMATKSEGPMDLSVFADYRSVCLPVKCGSTRSGIVCAFSHRDHLDERFDKFFKEGLNGLIEFKKHVESEKLGFDVGPAYAVAALIEDGDYARFLKRFETESSQLTGFEHVLQIKENSSTYHILPIDDELIFGNVEQGGLMRFSVFRALQGNAPVVKDVIRKKEIEWFMDNDELNRKKFRQILNGSMISRIDGIDRQFEKCSIHINVLERVKQEFELQQLLEQFEQPFWQSELPELQYNEA